LHISAHFVYIQTSLSTSLQQASLPLISLV
jgi:hypothetical protein